MTAELERALKLRKRTWGSENAARLRAMRDEVAWLKRKPMRWVKRMKDELYGLRGVGDGCYQRGYNTGTRDLRVPKEW